MPLKVSVIITTYNWPEALGAVLDSVANQDTLPHEVVIADDGSKAPTKQLIERYQRDFPCPILHIWHQDHGYQAAKIRNKAVVQASGDYLVFIDSDCLLRKDFLSQHERLTKAGHFIAGNRVLLSEAYTARVIKENIDVSAIKPFELQRNQVNRRWSLLPLPLGLFRSARARSWKGVKGCNMSMYTSDFLAANGFDENFEGWGYEDSDLVVRLLHAGIYRISGRFAVTVIHLWHNTNKSQLEEGNWKRLQETVNSGRGQAQKGISQYL